MAHKTIGELTAREQEILRIANETGTEYMNSRWTYVNSRILAELPGCTVSEGISTQLNSGIRDIAALVINIVDCGKAHNLDLGTPQELAVVVATQLSEIIAGALVDRKRIMI